MRMLFLHRTERHRLATIYAFLYLLTLSMGGILILGARWIRPAPDAGTQLTTDFAVMAFLVSSLTALLFVTVRKSLLRPLAELENTARKLLAGDFSVRFGRRTSGELKKLAAAFDRMATAIEERAQSLARANDELQHQNDESRRRHDRLNAVAESLQCGLMILDPEGRVTFANEAVSELVPRLRQGRLGICTHPCVGKQQDTRDCFACISGVDHPPTRCTLAVDKRVYELRTIPLYGAEGEEEERLVLSRDITDGFLAATRQTHQECLSVLGETAAVLAHELSNPLAAISMFSQMLCDQLDSSSPLAAHAEVIRRNMTSCKRTLRSLLAMAASSGCETSDFDAHDLVDEVVELLQPVAARDGTILHVDGEAVDGTVHGDELQLRQALVNLVMNALQEVSDKVDGEVTVGTSERAESLVIRVRDNGPGIPPMLRQRIFEPFFTTKPPRQGTGLGLSTARRVVEAQGGHLILDDSAQTTFDMVLPRHPGVGAPLDGDGSGGDAGREA